MRETLMRKPCFGTKSDVLTARRGGLAACSWTRTRGTEYASYKNAPIFIPASALNYWS